MGGLGGYGRNTLKPFPCCLKGVFKNDEPKTNSQDAQQCDSLTDPTQWAGGKPLDKLKKLCNKNIMAKETLTPKQKRFVLEYLKDSNGKQSAIRAGYAPKSAEVQASELLRLPKVQKFLKAKNDKIEANCEITKKYILSSLKYVADTSMTPDPMTGKIDATGANRALELLGKNKALFTEKIEQTMTLTLEHLIAGTHDDD